MSGKTYLTPYLTNDRQQVAESTDTVLCSLQKVSTNFQIDTASSFSVLLDQVVLTNLMCHRAVSSPTGGRPLPFPSALTDQVPGGPLRKLWSLIRSAQFWDVERTICLLLVVVTGKPQCPLVQSNGVSWMIQLSEQREASFFFPAAEGAPCFRQHLIVINLSGMAVQWKWRNGLPITASPLLALLGKRRPFCRADSPEHTGFSLGTHLKCILKMRKGSKGTHFFIYHLSRDLLTVSWPSWQAP